MFKIAVFVSGGGTNLQAVIDAIDNGFLSEVEIKLVVSSREDAYALERAKKHSIKTSIFDEGETLELIKENKIDLIVLAGFMTILSKSFIEEAGNAVINIHPSLIPSFCGKGFYGLRVHEEALKRGVKLTGATVHFVNSAADEGPIILQRAVEVYEGDTAPVLQKRVMEQAEQKILPLAIALISQGKIKIPGGC